MLNHKRAASIDHLQSYLNEIDSGEHSNGQKNRREVQKLVRAAKQTLFTAKGSMFRLIHLVASDKELAVHFKDEEGVNEAAVSESEKVKAEWDALKPELWTVRDMVTESNGLSILIAKQCALDEKLFGIRAGVIAKKRKAQLVCSKEERERRQLNTQFMKFADNGGIGRHWAKWLLKTGAADVSMEGPMPNYKPSNGSCDGDGIPAIDNISLEPVWWAANDEGWCVGSYGWF
jgi:hypothetical protein